jgi:hypothetical protein
MILAPTLSLSSGSGAAIVRPTFSRDFAGEKTLNNGTGPAITFTRASGATFFDANGVLQTAANAAPRFDHDPVTGASRGLLIEEQRTNLLLNSAALATQTVTVTAVAHTLSFYGTGEVVLSGVHSATVTGTGAFPTRTTLTFTPTAGSLTATVSGTAENAQLEGGAFPTSYIPTTTAAATRAADSAVVAPISSFYNQAEGTLFTESSVSRIVSGINYGIAAFGDPTKAFASANAIYGLYVSTTGAIAYNIFSAGASQVGALTNGAVPQNNTASKSIIAFKDNDVASSTNAASPVTDSTASIPQVTGLSIGLLSQGWGGGANHLNGHIRKIAYWPKRLTNTLLEQLTT